MDPINLLQELVSCPGPPGQELLVRTCLQKHLDSMDVPHQVDAKGNLIVHLDGQPSNIVVTAHMDEIAMMVTAVGEDGCLTVEPLGGLLAWKLGEGPVSILADGGPLDGILSFGSVHTESPSSAVVASKASCPDFAMAQVITGREIEDLEDRQVRPGTRVVVHPSRRQLTQFGDNLVSGYFLDDRADLVSWLLAIDALKAKGLSATFVATTCEEVGGHGALFYLARHRPDVCLALELGPNVPDAPVLVDDQPTLWVNDSFAAMLAEDISLATRVANDLGLSLQYQPLSSGGSDASCAASHGLCARPFTLGLAMDNSHGYEIMHKNAMTNLAALTAALVGALQGA